MKQSIIRITAVIIFMFLLLTSPVAALEGASYGLTLWYRTLFPTLMPFMVLSSFIVYTGCAKPIGTVFLPLTKLLKLPQSAGYCILTGFLCGYPMGAYVCGQLDETDELDEQTSAFLAPVCNNVSPMFMISYICISCIGDIKYSLPVMAVLIGSAFGCMIFFRLPSSIHNKENMDDSRCTGKMTDKNINVSTSQALTRSVENALSASLKLCIYVMLFSIAGSIIGQISFIPDTTKAALMSLMEITAGLDKISGLDIALKYKILMMLSFTAFGGMSSVLQTMSLWSGKNFHLKSYILYKLGIAAFTTLTTLLLIVIEIL